MQFKLPFGRRARSRSDSKSGYLHPAGRKTKIEKLFLHIGLPKTGTTSIQAYCLKNRNELLRSGILYPTTGLKGPGHMKLTTPFLSKIQKQNTVVDYPNETIRFDPFSVAIQEEIDDCPSSVDRMLISSERFAIVRGEWLDSLADALKNMRVLPMIYLRRQDYLAESLHAQAYRVRLPSFQPKRILSNKNRILCFWDLVSAWGKVFEPQNLIVRRFQKKSVTFDFLKAMGVERTEDLPTELRLNEGLNRDAMEYIRHHTNLEYGSQEYIRIERRLVEFSKNHPTPVQYKRFFSPQERIQLVETHAEQNRRVAQEFFGVSELFCDELPTLDEPWEKYPGLSPASKRQIEDFIREPLAA